MPDLLHTLQGNDLVFLKMVANAWGVELTAPDVRAALPVLVSALISRPLALEIIEALPGEARQALQALIENEGQLSWAIFSRRFGDVRAMGAARRDRERPDLKPASPAEILWYRALIGKAFLNTGSEPQEYAYIPDDLLPFVQPLAADSDRPYGRPASPVECAYPGQPSDRILDHACTVLAALRLNQPLSPEKTASWGIPLKTFTALLHCAGLLDENSIPLPEAARRFLEAPRSQALLLLCQSWMHSKEFNDLRMLPELKFEGEWQNDPFQTRQQILDIFAHLPAEPWWSISSLLNDIKERHPDFQRPAGDYDSWFIRKGEEYLRGFSSWDEVDGALVRFLITGPMYWLGLTELACSAQGGPATAFRRSPWADALLSNQIPSGFAEEEGKLLLFSDGRLKAQQLLPRSARYQVARFCEWDEETQGEYRYSLTPASLERARQQGLRPVHLLNLLRRWSPPPIPPAVIQALERWEKFGAQAEISPATLLKVASPEVLDTLRKSRAARYLGEALNPTTVILKPGGEQAVRQALAEAGYLTG